MKYKVIKEFPGFKIGSKINSTNHYNFKPELYPDFFEKVNESSLYITRDGVEVDYSTPVYRVQNYKTYFCKSGIHAYLNDLIFSTEESADNYIIKHINLNLEDKYINGENISIFGVCCISTWQLSTSTSLKLFQKRMNDEKESVCWKWFSTEEKRDEYVKLNKPLYNLNQIIGFGQYCYDFFDKSKNDTIEELFKEYIK